MNRRTVGLLSLGMLLLVAAALSAGWWYMAYGRWPLAGDLYHDFGDIPIVGRGGSRTHTFHLRNRTGQPLVIEAVRPGCGCTNARASTMRVESDGTIDIETTLSLSHAGRKKTSIALVIEGFGIQNLFIQGVGRREMLIESNQDHVAIGSGQTVPLLIFVEVQSSNDEPPVPDVQAPDAIDVTFIGWEQLRVRNPSTGRAARWRGRFEVALTNDESPQDLVLHIAVGEATLRIPVQP